MRRSRSILAAGLLLSASACATVRGVVADPVIVSASPESVSYRAAEGLRDETRESAKKHCRNQGRDAELERVIPGDDTERTFVYRCV